LAVAGNGVKLDAQQVLRMMALVGDRGCRGAVQLGKNMNGLSKTLIDRSCFQSFKPMHQAAKRSPPVIVLL
jgi:hypothetical protein